MWYSSSEDLVVCLVSVKSSVFGCAIKIRKHLLACYTSAVL